jgi:hypothetical protein
MTKFIKVLITAAVVVITAAVFFRIKSCGVDCSQCIENAMVKTVTVTKIDTVIEWKDRVLTWYPKQKSKLTSTIIEYLPADTAIQRQMSSDTNHIVDSIRDVDGVGLSFEHYVNNDQILFSKYKISYPSSKITIDKDKTSFLQIRKNAFDIGVSAYMYMGIKQPSFLEEIKNKFDVVPMVGYRYDKLRVSVGYGMIQNTIHVGINREF